MEEEKESLDIHKIKKACKNKDIDEALWSLVELHIMNMSNQEPGDRWTTTSLANLGKLLVDIKRLNKDIDQDDMEEMLNELLAWKNNE